MIAISGIALMLAPLSIVAVILLSVIIFIAIFLLFLTIGWYFGRRMANIVLSIQNRVANLNYAWLSNLWFAIVGPPLGPIAAYKVAAKRTNERLKLFGAFCNALGAGAIVASLIAPYFTNQKINNIDVMLYGCFMGTALHLLGQAVLRAMRYEG